MKQIELGFEVEADFHRTSGALDRDDPWFGRVQLETDRGDTVTYRVGERTVAEQDIVDWRDPASEPLYARSEGDWVDVDVSGRRIQGRLKNRARVRSRGRRLQQVDLFTEEGCRTVDLEAPAPGAGDVRGLPDIRSLLTKAQYDLIRSSRDRPVILRGRAGSGKTTVALYRVSWLTYPQPGDARPPVSADRVLIVMFNRALSAFVSQLLGPLRLDKAKTDTFHAWALEEIRRAYKGEIEVSVAPHEDREVAASVKRNLGMLDAVEAFVARQTERLGEWLQERLRPYAAADWEARFREESAPPVQRLERIKREVCLLRDQAEGHERQRLEQIIRIFDRAVFRMTRYKEELLALLTDRPLLREHLRGVQPWDLDMMVRFQQQLQHEGAKTRRDLGPYVTFEDFALLVRLIQLKHGGFPSAAGSAETRRFDHLLVDEAQDFGPVELTVLFQSVRSPQDITIVGDLNQKIVPDVDFVGWSRIAEKLGVSDAAVAHLEVGHRSTSPIMRLADFVLHLEASDEGRSGVKPTLDLLQNVDARTQRIVDRLEQRWAERPAAHLCVVCRQREDARALFEALSAPLESRQIPVRLGHNKSFEFGPGVTVTNARQLKGLEFDTVIVVDPGPHAYPDDLEGRRLFYTVITRAREVLHLISGIHPSPIIEAATEARLLDVVDETEIEPVRFGAEDDAPF